MLAARMQLNLARDFTDYFFSPRDYAPVSVIQAEYVALITLLRSVGNVFQSVDCTDPKLKAWSKASWEEWTQEVIFTQFIKPTRDKLIKEARGQIDMHGPAFGRIIVASTPSSRTGATKYCALDGENLLTNNGEKLSTKVREGLDYWERYLSAAEAASRQA